MTILRRCPCCNSVAIAVDGVTFEPTRVWWHGGEMSFNSGSKYYEVLWLLAVRHGSVVSRQEIVDWLYGHREDGGPDYAENIVSVFVKRLREKCVWAGAPLSIPRCRQSVGYELVVHPTKAIGVAA